MTDIHMGIITMVNMLIGDMGIQIQGKIIIQKKTDFK